MDDVVERVAHRLDAPAIGFYVADSDFAEEGVEAIFNELLGIGSIHAD